MYLYIIQDELLRTKKIDLPLLGEAELDPVEAEMDLVEVELDPVDMDPATVYTEERIPVYSEDRAVPSYAQAHTLTLDQPVILYDQLSRGKFFKESFQI